MPVKMIKGERVRQVRTKDVNRMRQNGWEVEEPPKPKRRRSSPDTSEAPEKDSGAFSRPETEEEGS